MIHLISWCFYHWTETHFSFEEVNFIVSSAFLPQGIRFLIDSSLLKNTSDDIGQFLYKGEGLNKTAIGDYLGER